MIPTQHPWWLPQALKQHGVRLASARGVNARAVSEHVMALMLALARRLPEARDNQAKRVWRGMIGDLAEREDELGGKTLLIVGLGQIGGRLAQLAKAFDMRVIGIRRDPRAGAGHADAVHAMSELSALLPQADFVALTCPLTVETEKVIDAEALGRMKPSAYLLNADPQAVAAADQNLAEMAHRLEAALRKPKMVADARGEGRAPPQAAPPAPAPENGVDAAAGEAASKPPR